MKIKVIPVLLFLSIAIMSQSLNADQTVKPSPNGIELPKGYKDWKVISISHRIDNNTLRTILGNDIAVKAARAGKTNPWPQGSILGKLVWKQQAKKNWPKAIAPDKFVHAEFMIKDSKQYQSTGGWGYARWKGLDQKPYGKDKNFAQECVSCHTPVKNNDWVFTTPAIIP
ncbi:Cytochrome p460 [hydrothermal vent metagenome]|uniref:Cytochrome p460 n=1 Tax=hydrothermal vent metagenome TaxID=652676 RepID=A0A3B1ALC4_9ZZZZ